MLISLISMMLTVQLVLNLTNNGKVFLHISKDQSELLKLTWLKPEMNNSKNNLKLNIIQLSDFTLMEIKMLSNFQFFKESTKNSQSSNGLNKNYLKKSKKLKSQLWINKIMNLYAKTLKELALLSF